MNKGTGRQDATGNALENNELGISVKLNNAVMKNSRLQRTAPNFCGKWNFVVFAKEKITETIFGFSEQSFTKTLEDFSKTPQSFCVKNISGDSET